MRTLEKREIDQLSAGIPPVVGAAIVGGIVQSTYDVFNHVAENQDNLSIGGVLGVAAKGFVEGAILGAVGLGLTRLLRW